MQVGEDANLLDLGYNSSNDLKETIYGNVICNRSTILYIF